MKRLVTAALFMALLCVFSAPAFAETVEQNGLKVTLYTDKEIYKYGEEIVAGIQMSDGTNGMISDIQISPYVSNLYTVTDEQQTQIEIGSLDANEDIKIDVYFGIDKTNLPETGDSFDLTGSLICTVVTGCLLFLYVRGINEKRWISFVLVVCLLSSTMSFGLRCIT